MNFIPKGTFLGELRIVNVFEFFDFPLLFTCVNRHKQVYLVVAIEEFDDRIDWLYSPISDKTLHDLRSSVIDFKSAFLESQNGFSFVVSVSNDGVSSVNYLLSKEIPDDYLPDAGEKAKCCTGEHIVPYYAEVKNIADETNRGVLNFILNVANRYNEISARHLCNIVGNLQSVVDALGYKISGHAQRFRGSIPKLITDQTELDIAFSFPGSFGVQLRSFWNTYDASFTLVEESLKLFIKLIDSQDDHDSLKDQLCRLDPRAVSRYSAFLDSVSKSEFGFSCQYGSPKSQSIISTSIAIDKVRDNLVLVKEVEKLSEEISVEGVIKGIFIRHKRFDIVDYQGDIYTGTILDEAMEQASHAQINARCVAVLVKEKVKNVATEDIKTRWNLLSLEVAGDSDN